jgi:N-acyl homoserine lactone hydrolase
VAPVQVVPFLVSELRLDAHERELLQREWWPSYAHAVVHRDGVFLFDNGVGFGDPEVEAAFTPRVRPLAEALTAHGMSFADVTGVANCHLHFDHCGQNGAVPSGIPIFVQRSEWAMVHEPDYTVPGWVDVPGLSYEVLDGEHEVAPGIRLIPTPGHTVGHQSAVLTTDDGPVVLAGQALQSAAEWDGATSPVESGESTARDGRYADSVLRLRGLDPVRVHFAHDDVVWQHQPEALRLR